MLELFRSKTGSSNVFARLSDVAVQFVRRSKDPKDLILYTEVHDALELALLRFVAPLIKRFNWKVKTTSDFVEKFNWVSELDGDEAFQAAERSWEEVQEKFANGPAVALEIPERPANATEPALRDETTFMRLVADKSIAYNLASREAFTGYQKQFPEAVVGVVLPGPVWLFGEHGELISVVGALGKDGGLGIPDLVGVCWKGRVVYGVHHPSEWVGKEIDYCRRSFPQTHTYVKVHMGELTTFWCFSGSWGGFLGVLVEEQPAEMERMFTLLKTRHKNVWTIDQTSTDWYHVAAMYPDAVQGIKDQDAGVIFAFDKHEKFLGALRSCDPTIVHRHDR